MTDYREKIAQAEKNATKIVEHLIKLKDEAEGFRTATDSLDNVTVKIDNLITELMKVSEAVLAQTIAIKEIDTHNILTKLEETSLNQIYKIEKIKKTMIGGLVIVAILIVAGYFL